MALPFESFSDQEVLDSLLKNEQSDAALKYLYRAYFDFLNQYVRANNGSEHDAQDLFQEVLITFVHLVKEGKFRGEASIKTFLYALTRNKWLNELKKRGRSNVREKSFGQAQEVISPSQVQAMEQQQTTRTLLRVMDDLGEACKKILLLFYYEKQSMKEIVSAMAYENEQVARTKKYKCLKKLEERIRENQNLHGELKNFSNG